LCHFRFYETVSLSVYRVCVIYNVRSQLQQWDVVCEQLFLMSYLPEGLLRDAEHDVLVIAKFLVVIIYLVAFM